MATCRVACLLAPSRQYWYDLPRAMPSILPLCRRDCLCLSSTTRARPSSQGCGCVRLPGIIILVYSALLACCCGPNTSEGSTVLRPNCACCSYMQLISWLQAPKKPTAGPVRTHGSIIILNARELAFTGATVCMLGQLCTLGCNMLSSPLLAACAQSRLLNRHSEMGVQVNER